MHLSDRTTLYHGSYAKVQEPDLSKCARRKDFGRGFYLTTDYGQASSFVRLSIRKARELDVVKPDARMGYVSRFAVCESELERLDILSFADADEEWLRCVVAHRRELSFPGIVQELSEYDVVVGKIANDRTNITLALYMDGVYGQVGTRAAAQACIRQLLPDRLKDQYCFRTERSLRCLHYEGSDEVWT